MGYRSRWASNGQAQTCWAVAQPRSRGAELHRVRWQRRPDPGHQRRLGGRASDYRKPYGWGASLRCIGNGWLTGVELPMVMAVGAGKDVSGRSVRWPWRLVHRSRRSVVPGRSSGSWLLDRRRVTGDYP
jgi:hypothetical protein